MKKLLLVGFYVPPRSGVGALRTRQLIEHLPRFGWQVTALAPHLPDVSYDGIPSVHTAPVRDFKATIKRLAGIAPDRSGHEALGVSEAGFARRRSLKQRIAEASYGVTDYANRKFGWLPWGAKAAARLLGEERFDAVLSTSPPETVHIVVSRAITNTPWVADFRDLWLRPDAHGALAIRTILDRHIERATLRKCSAMTTVSEPLAAQLRARYPDIPVVSIPNAFDAAEWKDIPFERTERCTIVYAGQLYAGMRDPSPLFRALRRLLDRNALQRSAIVIDFYTRPAQWLMDLVASFELEDVVRIQGEQARIEVLKLERRATALLLLLWDHPSETGVYTGKLFEYLGARRPILAVGGPELSVVDDVLLKTGCPPRCRDVDSLEATILEIVQHHARGGDIKIDESTVEPFESIQLASRFASVLDLSVNR